MALSESLSFDRRLAADDVEGSRAHVAMLAAVGPAHEPRSATRCSPRSTRWRPSSRPTPSCSRPTDEDIHTAVERRVTELAGDAGRQAAHRAEPQRPGRHRPPPVDQARPPARSSSAIDGLQRVLVARAEEAGDDVAVPGYTHLQHAQPVLLAHHLLAHVWALGRDVERWRRVVDGGRRLAARRRRAGGVEPAARSRPHRGATLGFAAPVRELARRGVRSRLRRRGGVRRRARAGAPVAPRRGDRALVVERVRVPAAAGRVRHRLVDDAAEEEPRRRRAGARARPGRVIGDLTGLLATLKGLPLAYNRDLQEDKEPLFDAVDTLHASLLALTGLARRRHVR